jgi:hypothetical protein
VVSQYTASPTMCGWMRVLDVHHQAHAGLGSAAGREKFASVPCSGGSGGMAVAAAAPCCWRSCSCSCCLSTEDLMAILESGNFTQLQPIQLTALVTIPSIPNYNFIIWNRWVPNINPLASFVEKTQYCQ